MSENTQSSYTSEKQYSSQSPKKTMSSGKKVTLRIFRYNPQRDKKDQKKYDEFEISAEKWTTVLDAILHVKQYMDPSVGVRYSCRQAACGSCGMKINGRPSLACYTKISELDSDVITVDPMDNFPIMRDLVSDLEGMFSSHKSVKPYIMNEKSEVGPNTREFLQSPEEVEEYLQFSYCIKCGLCNSACPTMATDSQFIGPQGLAQAYRYVADNRDEGKKERFKAVDKSHGIWRCHFAGSCSRVCPKGVDPALGIQLLRGYLLGFKK